MSTTERNIVKRNTGPTSVRNLLSQATGSIHAFVKTRQSRRAYSPFLRLLLEHYRHDIHRQVVARISKAQATLSLSYTL